MPEDPHKPAVDVLIDELGRDGVPTGKEPATFTLDRKVALQKLEKYQLEDPHAYVLELVQAVRLKGATWVDFRIDTDDTILRCDGRPFSAAELQDVYASVFQRAGDDDTRAVQQLALGLNAARALRPRWIRVSSGDETTRHRLEIRGRRRSQRVEATTARPAPPEGRTQVTTEIHFKGGLRMRLLQRFVANLMMVLPEERLIHERCRFADFEIRLDGHPVHRGLTVPGAAGSRPLTTPGCRGEAARTPDMHRARIHWIKHGVIVATEVLEEQAFQGYEAVAEVNGLRKNVSQSDVVRDELYQSCLRHIRESWLSLGEDPAATQQVYEERDRFARAAVDAFHPKLERRWRWYRRAKYGSSLAFALFLTAELWIFGLGSLTERWWAVLVAVGGITGLSYVIGQLAKHRHKRIVREAIWSFEEQFPRNSPMRAHAICALRERCREKDAPVAEMMLMKL